MDKNTLKNKLLDCIDDFKNTIEIDYKYYKSLCHQMEKEAKRIIGLQKNLAKHINRAGHNC